MRDRVSAVGRLVAAWRSRRGISQLDLSLQTGVSTKHISFIETGRSQPSRAMLQDLCEALAVPPRHRNEILLAGGYAPVFPETPIEHGAMADAAEALGLILRSAEPSGAVVFDRRWDLVMANQAYLDWAEQDLPGDLRPYEVTREPRPNIVTLLTEAPAYRAMIANWPEVADGVLQRLRADIATRSDAGLQVLADRLERARGSERPGGPSAALLPVELRLGRDAVRLVNTISVLGGAGDLTLRDLRIEIFHPMTASDAAALRAWSAGRAAPHQPSRMARM